MFVRCVLCLFTVVSLLGARGCPSGRATSAKARLLVEIAPAQGLSPSDTSASAAAEAQVAIGKVVAHTQGTEFRAEVAKAAGVSPETVSMVAVQRVADTRIVEVRAELPDRQLAAKLVNAVATRLADDFRNDPNVKVRVLAFAEVPAPVKEESKK